MKQLSTIVWSHYKMQPLFISAKCWRFYSVHKEKHICHQLSLSDLFKLQKVTILQIDEFLQKIERLFECPLSRVH
jgi:hypothetical protein